MEIVKIIEDIAKWIGMVGITVALTITTVSWVFYDISEDLSPLTTIESIGLLLFSILIVALVKAVYIFIRQLQGKKNKNV